MFNPIRKKLSFLYTFAFFLLLLLFIIGIYFLIIKAVEDQQIKELEKYYLEEQHDLLEHLEDKDKKIEFDPNRSYFYYVFDHKSQLVDGDESFYGFYQDLKKHLTNDVTESAIYKVEWKDEHLLLLQEPIVVSGQPLGFIVVGQSITDQQHFIQKMIWIFFGMTCLFSILLAFLSYYLAGKAVIPIQKSFEKQKKFVSDASHELRTPLSIFYSSVELLESEEKQKLSPLGQEILDDLKSETYLMNGLLEDLLFLARHDQDEWQAKKEKFPLSDTLLTIGKKFSRTLPTSIHFEMNIEENIQMYGDALRLQELLYILLDNAARYTEQGKITLSLIKQTSFAKIIVEDTGIGMKKDVLPHIFDRFYRSDPARVRTGTGLGLSIAQKIIKIHHGSIEVESEEGKGTIFTVSLPLE
ncbi:signal transduction histidine kinase [Oikeobacillus pervagus]|uniref:histidine kinase n=1 Tax=Oikeobacillus pervagus TaxID=1325931 RepID=A0AAJ1T319_9BACI|nr:HAMP domain-containing sensor histidine kinase [Oikeobacillus pervagus]MDQ0215756.1 signal transduction histidine kinase [Oikeobacillus pervagus]